MTGTILDRLRQQAQEKAADQTTDLPVVGYKDPELVVRYRFLDVDATTEIGVKVRAAWETDEERILHGGMKVMAEACEGLYTRERGGELVPLDLGGGQAVFGPDLDAAFGFETSAPYRVDDTILQLFHGNGYAVLEHAALLQRWMSDTTRKAVDSLGER